ncbi:protein phosphatase [Gammaproteobacteria bacterium 45_16_T64]|nr:protein phosphatase [Gammaproteobacteria bacterium 45_16_T64]
MTEQSWLESATTHCGAVRNMNEDSLMSRTEDSFWVVADGMGGHDAGEVASEMITTALGKMNTDLDIPDLVDSIEDTLLEVHHEIRVYSRTHCDGRTMGSTVVAMFARDKVGVCMWAGDSRLYRYRGGMLEQISEDHSQVNEMLARGLITEEEAVNHPSSNVITRAVGATDILYVDVTVFEMKPKDIYVLCSDGLYGALSHDEMLSRLRLSSVEDYANDFVNDALKNEARDNVTVIAVQAV